MNETARGRTSSRDTADCVYFAKDILALAPEDKAGHLELLRTVTPGTRLEILLTPSRLWCESLVWEKLDKDLWLMGLSKDPGKEPRCYHLLHSLKFIAFMAFLLGFMEILVHIHEFMAFSGSCS